MNVDQQEVNKFASLSSRWWDDTGEFKTLHEINPLRLDYIIKRAGKLAGKKILDVGCGGGILTEALAGEGAELTGIDAGEAALKVARLHKLTSGNEQIDYELSTVEDYAERYPGGFDVVTCMELLEHVPDPESVVQACLKLVKPGGDVFFSTLNRTSTAYLSAVVGAEYILRMLPVGTHDYARFIKPSELARWIRQHGDHVADISGLDYHPFGGQHRLSSNTSINYLLHAQTS